MANNKPFQLSQTELGQCKRGINLAKNALQVPFNLMGLQTPLVHPQAPPAIVGMATILRHSVRLYCAIILDDGTMCTVINMHSDYVCVRADGHIERKVNGREGGTPSCLICAVLLTSARRTLYSAIPANQEAKLFFLQFVAGAAHHKCFQ